MVTFLGKYEGGDGGRHKGGAPGEGMLKSICIVFNNKTLIPVEKS